MSHDMKQFLDFILGSFLAVFVITSIFAFVFGATTANKDIKGCEYRSVISYHPARILACELFKERW